MAYHWDGTTGARAKILAAMNTVTNIGQVYDYERFADDWETLLALFKATISSVDQFRGWTIALEGVDSEMIGFGNSGDEVEQLTYRVRIRGILGENDATGTQKTFEALILSAKQALEAATALHDNDLAQGASGRFASDGPVQIPVIDLRQFSDVLCHYGELALRIQEVV